MNEEGNLIDVPRIYSVLKESLNPGFLSCPSDDKNGGVCVDFWIWILNTNNQSQSKTTPLNIMKNNHSSRNNEENTVYLLAYAGSKI